MSIELKIETNQTYSWEDFKKSKPPFSIALDGFVHGPTKRDALGPYANFDHHSLVDRISTRSTAEQIHMEINLGLFDTFKKDGKPHIYAWVNDCDEDTCLSVWLLQNHERVLGHGDPLINKLVYCSDRLDSTAGSYPFGDISQLRKMAWIFEPYRNARSEGRLSRISESETRAVIEAVLGRITAYSIGEGKEIPIETSYKVLGGGKNWSIVKESSTAARMVMFSSGINAFVSVVGDGRYVIGRKSTWTPFDLETIFCALNNAEGLPVESPAYPWGGSNTIGGCLRGMPTRLTLGQITKVIEAALASPIQLTDAQLAEIVNTEPVPV